MKENITQIPFSLNNKNGIIEVCYEENKSAEKSGFNLFSGLGFDPNLCMGYPTMHASVKQFEGAGYYCTSGWIQIITDKFYSSNDDTTPALIETEVDVNDFMRKCGVPFFALGFPSEIFDAPCNNLQADFSRLDWIADTFFVTQPSRINDNTVSYITGFRWGYTEWDSEGKRNIAILPLSIIDHSVWHTHLPLLQKDFSNWNFK